MTRGRTIWLLLLAAGLAAGLLLRAPKRERFEEREVSSRSDASARSELVEVEVVDPNELDASVAPRTAVNPKINNESQQLASLAATWKSDPERALLLAEEGERRFGDSPRAVERRFYEIKALVEVGRVGSARTKAQRYLELYPPGPMTEDIERLTGVHRRPAPTP